MAARIIPETQGKDERLNRSLQAEVINQYVFYVYCMPLLPRFFFLLLCFLFSVFAFCFSFLYFVFYSHFSFLVPSSFSLIT